MRKFLGFKRETTPAPPIEKVVVIDAIELGGIVIPGENVTPPPALIARKGRSLPPLPDSAYPPGAIELAPACDGCYCADPPDGCWEKKPSPPTMGGVKLTRVEYDEGRRRHVLEEDMHPITGSQVAQALVGYTITSTAWDHTDDALELHLQAGDLPDLTIHVSEAFWQLYVHDDHEGRAVKPNLDPPCGCSSCREWSQP